MSLTPKGNVLKTILSNIESITRWLMSICLVSLMAMMMLTTVDVIGRYFFKSPLVGAFEFTEFLLVISVASGLAYTQTVKGHIVVDLFVVRFSSKHKKIIYAINHLFSIVLYILITWRSLIGAQTQLRNSVTSGAYELPIWPFYCFLSFCCGIVTLIFMRDLLKLFTDKVY